MAQRFRTGVLLIALCFLPACRGCDAPPVAMSGFVPEDAVGVATLAPAAEWTPPLIQFLAGFGESEGALEWFRLRYRVDARTGDGIVESGFCPDLPAHVFALETDVFLVAPLVNEERARDSLEPIFFRQGGEERVPEDDSVSFSWVLPRDTGSAGCVIGKGVLLCGQSRNADGLFSILSELLERDPEGPSLLASPQYAEAVNRWGDAGGLTVYIRGNESMDYRMGVDRVFNVLRAPLGAAGFALAGVQEFLKKARFFSGSVQVHKDTLRVRAAATFPDGTMASLADYTTFEPAAPDYGRMLPRDTAVLMRMRVNLAKVRAVYGMLLAMAPQDILAQVHSLFRGVRLSSQLLNHMTGEFAVGFLGFERNVAPMKAVQASTWQQGIRALGLVLAFQVKDMAAFEQAWQGFEIGTKRYERVDAPDIEGVAQVFRIRPKGGKGLSVGVFRLEDTVLVSLGRGGYLEIRGVLEGRATSLGRRVEGPEWKSFVKGSAVFFGSYASFLGVSRTLEERGAIPFFVRLLGEFYEAGVEMKIDGESATFGMEVRQ